MLFIPITLSGNGARARVVSSVYTSCSSTVAPRPPYSRGQDTAAQPASAIVRFHARSVSNVASSRAGGPAGGHQLIGQVRGQPCAQLSAELFHLRRV